MTGTRAVVGALLVLAVLAAWSLARVRREYRERRELSPATVVLVWLLYGLHFVMALAAAAGGAWRLPLPSVPAVIAGSMLAVLGVALCAAGIATFRSFDRMSGRDTSELVTSGIYRFSRNPQNVGLALFFLGISLAGRSGLALLLAALFWLMFRVYVPIEEDFLESVFGPQYRDYRRRAPRYLGPPRRA